MTEHAIPDSLRADSLPLEALVPSSHRRFSTSADKPTTRSSRDGAAKRLLLFVALAALPACGASAPPRMPDARVPAVDVRADAPPAPGTGRVIFDVAGGAGFVDEVRYRTRTYDQDPSGEVVPFQSVGGESTLPLCRTPCVMDLTLGSHEIAFTRLDTGARDTDIVALGADVTVVRHAVGYRRHYRSGLLLGGVLLATLGGIGLTVGSGLAIAPSGATPEELDQHRQNGIIAAAASLGVTALGALMILMAPERDAPGPTRQWVLPASEDRTR